MCTACVVHWAYGTYSGQLCWVAPASESQSHAAAAHWVHWYSNGSMHLQLSCNQAQLMPISVITSEAIGYSCFFVCDNNIYMQLAYIQHLTVAAPSHRQAAAYPEMFQPLLFQGSPVYHRLVLPEMVVDVCSIMGNGLVALACDTDSTLMLVGCQLAAMSYNPAHHTLKQLRRSCDSRLS